MEIKSYRDLRVWEEGLELSVAVYELTSQFPATEKYGLVSQLRRASVSVPSNISEGHARESTREFLHFISISMGSVAEIETQLCIASRLHLCTDEQHQELENRYSTLGKQLRALAISIRRKLDN